MQPPPTTAAVVTVSRPVSREVTSYAKFTGRTAAVESVEVRARVSGYLTEVNYQPGEEVEPGRALFRIDPVIYKASLAKAEADVKRYEAQVTELTTEVNRNRRLAGAAAVTREELEKTVSQRDQAKANQTGAEAAVQTARQNVTWTDVVAPVAGKTGVNQLTKGNLVVADQTLLTTVVSQDPMYVYFDVDMSTMLHVQALIRQGKAKSYREAAYPIAVALTSETGYPHQGTIDFVSNQVSPGTGTLNVRGKLSNAARILTPGLFVRVQCPSANRTPRCSSPTGHWGTTRDSPSFWRWAPTTGSCGATSGWAPSRRAASGKSPPACRQRSG